MNLLLIDTSNIAYVLANQIGLESDLQLTEDLELILRAKLAFINSRVWLVNNQEYHVIWLLDSKPYWRSIYEPEYKAHRGISPINRTIIKLTKIVEENFYSLRFLSFEADDIAGKIVSDYGKNNKIVLVSTDSDWHGLVNENVCIYNPIYPPMHRTITETFAWLLGKVNKSTNYVKQRFIVPPIMQYKPRIIWDFKSLQGDSTDNLNPGTALGLIDLLDPFMCPNLRFSDVKNSPIRKYSKEKANEFLSQGISPFNGIRIV